MYEFECKNPQKKIIKYIVKKYLAYYFQYKSEYAQIHHSEPKL